MSHPVFNRRAAARSHRLLLRAAAVIVLGSILYAGVDVSAVLPYLVNNGRPALSAPTTIPAFMLNADMMS